MDTLPPEFLILVVAVASAIAGGLLTWVTGYVTGGGKGKRQRRQPPVAATQADQESPAPPDERELLCVSRTKKGRLAVFVQGQRYRHLQEITDPQVGDETIEALKAVLSFAEGWLPSVPQTPPPPAPTVPAVDEEVFLEQLRQSHPSPPRRPPDLLNQLPIPTPHTLLEPLTFVDEIDDLVQQRLRKRPDLAEQRIRLTTDKDGSLRIHVDQQTFEAVDDVPDPQVRALIHDAIREWEGG